MKSGEADPAPFVVGLGASAGGLEALEAFLRAVPPASGLAFVVVQHLSPDHKSHLAELLSRYTSMPVVAAEDGAKVEPNTVHLIPPRKLLTIDEGLVLHLVERGGGLTLPVDVLFRSMAEHIGLKAVGVILSGTGSDGMRGVRALKEAGGLVLAQDPSTARFDGMPRAAISTGVVDYVLPVPEMPARLCQYASRVVRIPPVAVSEDRAEEAFAQITSLLRRQTGVDFARYKASTVSRRIHRRMAICDVETIDDYRALAESSPREVSALFRELLIGVTRFFRDPDAFEVLRREVIPALLENSRPGEAIRVWVAGCSTGEEAYSLAMLFEEYFEAGGRPREVKVFATDIDRDALEFAGAGLYPESIAADVSPDRLARFFVRRGDQYQVARFLRQRVVFASHDLTRDPPFGRVSLISCRNLLIYFTPPLQAQVLAAFRFALRPGGFLFLGASETAGEASPELAVVDVHSRVYRRTTAGVSAIRPIVGAAPPRVLGMPAFGRSSPKEVDQVRSGLDVLLTAFAPPSVLVNEHLDVLHFFGPPSRVLRLPAGEPSLNLLHLLPSAIASVVGLSVHRALREDTAVECRGVPTDEGLLAISVRPVPSPEGAKVVVVSLAFEQPSAEVSEPLGVNAEAAQRINELQRELQFSRESLQATIEELETSNEELQATNEELMAANEELQSTNEELQSVNEELHTLNTEYQQKIGELVRLGEDINNLLLSTRLGVVFLDAELRVTRFTPAVTEVMSLLDRDLGRPIAHLSLRFDADWFFSALDEVASSHTTVEREFLIGSERYYRIQVAPYVSEGSTGGLVISALDVTELKDAERHLARVMDALPLQVALLDAAGTILLVNRAWNDFALANGGTIVRTGPGTNYLHTCDAANDPLAEAAAKGLRALLRGERERLELEYPCHSPTEERWFLLQARPVVGGGLAVAHLDITQRKRIELNAQQGAGVAELGEVGRA